MSSVEWFGFVYLLLALSQSKGFYSQQWCVLYWELEECAVSPEFYSRTQSQHEPSPHTVNCNLSFLGLWVGWGRVGCLRQAWNETACSFPWIPLLVRSNFILEQRIARGNWTQENKHCVKVNHSVMSVLSNHSDPDTLLTCCMSLDFYWFSCH